MKPAEMSRIDELQADRALWGLDPESEQELERALRDGNIELDDSWEHCAAVLTLALQADIPSAPSLGLLESLRMSAPGQLKSTRTTRRRVRLVNALLAAALVTMTVMVFWDHRTEATPTHLLRQKLLHTSGTALLSWGQGGTDGDVVWHGTSQKGYMRFRNLPANDPKQHQYQLWIVDAKRHPAHPVDGGVFDVPPGQTETIVPVDAKLLVHEAQAFVVTIEPPGGVVVSRREQIVALAKPQ